MSNRTALAALSALALLAGIPAAGAETLRLLTWSGYAPDAIVKKFEAENPGITVEVTLSNNEEMIAKLRATGGAGFDLAQPSHDRIFAVESEYGVYKPMDWSKIDQSHIAPKLIEAVKANDTVEGKVYAFPHQWGTSGLMADMTKAPGARSWSDLCDAKYAGRTSMRLRRTILLGTAFGMGKDPFAAYADLAGYKALMNEVADRLIACKKNVKTYWTGGDDLAALMLSGEVVLSEAWDSTAFKLYGQNRDIRYVPPKTGALTWVDTFAIPAKGQADEAAYKWINFVLRADNVPAMSASTGAIAAVKNGIDLLPADKRDAVQAAFTEEDLGNMKFFANIPPGIEEIEGEVLDRIQAAN
ncbi:spermidine/putrescine ABC transporter substrate-binding protein [Aureimonas endophytica]|uniref:Spermidine/putrescine ABC transporter substrate-binding protein n=1 Tax=Aureimonas endophytica TaxID=2027858 RepID=A0A916ZG37_9HYPH|nr:extracellular solute-binding protein [Aureimonas endophytica]GGD95688.1 spermidine/putrescine ABC transporter substrate-binding protein [Aureimonas endophytica]